MASKITTIADALKCISKVRQGKACSAAEMKASLLLLSTAYGSLQRRYRAEKAALTKSDNMVSRLLSRLNV